MAGFFIWCTRLGIWILSQVAAGMSAVVQWALA